MTKIAIFAPKGDKDMNLDLSIVMSQTVGEYLLQTQHPNFRVDVHHIKSYELPVYLAFRKGTININKVNKELNKIKSASNL